MFSENTKRQTKVVASKLLAASGCHTRSTTGSKSSSLSKLREAMAETQRMAPAATAGSTSWQRGSNRGRSCSTKSRIVVADVEGSSFNNISMADRTDARTLGSLSQSPKWKYRDHCCCRKLDLSQSNQFLRASKHSRRISESTSFVRRLKSAKPRASRVEERDFKVFLVSFCSSESSADTSSSPLLADTAPQSSLRDEHCAQRPSARCRAATVATCRMLRNWHSDSASVQSRSLAKRPFSKVAVDAEATSSFQRTGKFSRTRWAPRSWDTSQCCEKSAPFSEASKAKDATSCWTTSEGSRSCTSSRAMSAWVGTSATTKITETTSAMAASGSRSKRLCQALATRRISGCFARSVRTSGDRPAGPPPGWRFGAPPPKKASSKPSVGGLFGIAKAPLRTIFARPRGVGAMVNERG
mmetsp:Transcript_79620/g.165390  ORF Transcript_79620/g.165390 Transcript_79620/m.165390 type:complete len:413 (-) Transcript_79620:81-1319(-)